MPITQKTTLEYECGLCRRKAEVDPMARHAWVTITMPGIDTEVFCGWECVGHHATKKTKEAREAEDGT